MAVVPLTPPEDISPPPAHRRPRRPEELLGRRVRYRGDVGRVVEAHVLGEASVAVATRDGRLLRVPARDWGDLQLL